VGRIKLHWWIFIGMIVGAALGWWVHGAYGDELAPSTAAYAAFDGLAEIFLQLLRMVVLPLVFFSLLSGIVGVGDLAHLGRMGTKTLALYIATSLLALLTGMALVNLIRPGVGLDIEIPTKAVERPETGSVWDFVGRIIPDNPVRAAAEFDLLGVIFFAVLFGIFLATLEASRKKTLVELIDTAAEVMMRMTRFVLLLAPVGIAALIARMVSTTGPHVFAELKWYAATVALGLALHLLVTLPLILWVVTRRNPYRFLRAMSPALVTGFSTASSSGTLAVTMECAEKRAGVSNRVASFVLPIGATINMDGTALYEIVTVLFIAQVHAGVDPSFSLTAGQQLLIVVLGLAVSIGAAGIPHAGLVMMVIILEAVGLPVEYTALIWAIDRPLDMARTMTNIASDASITMIVAQTESEVDDTVLAS